MVIRVLQTCQFYGMKRTCWHSTPNPVIPFPNKSYYELPYCSIIVTLFRNVPSTATFIEMFWRLTQKGQQKDSKLSAILQFEQNCTLTYIIGGDFSMKRKAVLSESMISKIPNALGDEIPCNYWTILGPKNVNSWWTLEKRTTGNGFLRRWIVISFSWFANWCYFWDINHGEGIE
jgi:hypothetical protein